MFSELIYPQINKAGTSAQFVKQQWNVNSKNLHKVLWIAVILSLQKVFPNWLGLEIGSII